MTRRRSTIEAEDGSGNVFADLGLKDSDELLTRAQIGFCVYKIIKAKKLTQREIARLLGIAQPEVRHLMNGHYSTFTTDAPMLVQASMSFSAGKQRLGKRHL